MRHATRTKRFWPLRRSLRTAAEVLTTAQLAVLADEFPRLTAQSPAREAWRCVARLGGFLVSQRRVEPGGRTLWRGLQELMQRVHGCPTALRWLEKTALHHPKNKSVQ